MQDLAGRMDQSSDFYISLDQILPPISELVAIDSVADAILIAGDFSIASRIAVVSRLCTIRRWRTSTA
jgi:hypothetical protein